MNKSYTTIILILLLCQGCKKFVEIEPPRTELVSETVFSNDVTATAAILDIYSSLRTSGFASGGKESVTYLSSLSADELFFFDVSDVDKKSFFDNTLLSTNNSVNGVWTSIYQTIYKANAILIGLDKSDRINIAVKKRLQSEARFFRAFGNFYLVNLFGDVPIVTSIDYKDNIAVSRNLASEVYKSIVDDLKWVIENLDESYVDAGNNATINDRSRINKYAAMALLARVYLYTKDWENAESISNTIISHSNLYELMTLDSVFLRNSKEAIWQLSSDFSNPEEATLFTLTPDMQTPYYISLKDEVVNSFHPKDKRRAAWIGTHIPGSETFYYSAKYKNTSAIPPVTEHSMVLRLGEQYLIRAEARIHQEGKRDMGIADLNILRERASFATPDNVPLLVPGLTFEQAQHALEDERIHELFTEWGHRWLDLKRWPSVLSPSDKGKNRADDILSAIKPGWRTEWKLYPIPQAQIQNAPAMADQQNPGYD